MTLSMEELVKKIAAKNKIMVSVDDPALIIHTINEHFLEEQAKSQQAMLAAFKSELEEISKRWGLEAKEKAEAILNAALEASTKMMEDGARAIIKDAETHISETTQNISTQVVHDASKISKINLFASALTAVAAFVALWITFTH
jgi:ElaB/YqjD/DUF883 family membrane-anchored ribosome-binding protein